MFGRCLENRSSVKYTDSREKHVDDRLTLLVHAARIDSTWSSGENLRLSCSEAVPVDSCWNIPGNYAGGILGTFAFVCDDFRHLFDSNFAWTKVRQGGSIQFYSIRKNNIGDYS